MGAKTNGYEPQEFLKSHVKSICNVNRQRTLL